MLPGSPETTIARESLPLYVFFFRQQGHTSKAAYRGRVAYWAVFGFFFLSFLYFLFLFAFDYCPATLLRCGIAGTVDEELTGGVLHLGSHFPKVAHGGYEGWTVRGGMEVVSGYQYGLDPRRTLP